MNIQEQENSQFIDLDNCLRSCWTAVFQCKRLINTFERSNQAVKTMFELLRTPLIPPYDPNRIELLSPSIHANILHAEILFCLEGLNIAKNHLRTISSFSPTLTNIETSLMSDQNWRHIKFIRNVWIHADDYHHGHGIRQRHYEQNSSHGQTTADSIQVNEESILIGAHLDLIQACNLIIAKYPEIYQAVCEILGWDARIYAPSNLDLIAFEHNFIRR